MLVAALTSGQKIGIASVGAAFIVFALVCSLWIPRRNPNFPGKHLGWFVVACIAFMIAMLSAVIVFGQEKEEPASAAAATTTASTTTSATSTAPTTTAPTPSASAAGRGSATAGKAVFTSAGCSGCHTLKAANATGKVGPNLDTLKPPYDKIVTQVENGGAVMPPFKGQLSVAQIHNVAAFVFTSTHS